MTKLVFHGITFTIRDDVNVTDELKAKLEGLAIQRIKCPVAIWIKKGLDGQSGRNYEFASKQQIESNPPSVSVTINGIQTAILLPGEEPLEIDDRDIEVARRIWTDPAIVCMDEGHLFIDFQLV